MIIDKIEHSHLYKNIGERISQAFEYIKTTDFSSLDLGKYEIDGKNLYASVSKYMTKVPAESKLEGHEKYIDVQFMVKGTELFGYVPLGSQKPVVDYNPEKDVTFYKEETSFFKLESGSFAIFFPHDLHMPGVCENLPSEVVKVVVKVKID